MKTTQKKISWADRLIESMLFVFLFFSLITHADQPETLNTKIAESAHMPAIKVILNADKSIYRFNEKIVIQVLLTNNSELPVYVNDWLDWGESASVSLWLKDLSSGKDMAQTMISDAISPPPSSKDDFVKLLPNHVYGIIIITNPSELGAQKNGTYELVAQYHSPIPASMSYGLPILSRENGKIISNRISLKVKN
ncbi:MAG: hypothetical protein LBQ20_02600 [Rhodanobacter sp.]|jgi:hypothetical protein|nr:hypothetical protein [Rhodanobacter sp.]